MIWHNFLILDGKWPDHKYMQPIALLLFIVTSTWSGSGSRPCFSWGILLFLAGSLCLYRYWWFKNTHLINSQSSCLLPYVIFEWSEWMIRKGTMTSGLEQTAKKSKFCLCTMTHKYIFSTLKLDLRCCTVLLCLITLSCKHA